MPKIIKIHRGLFRWVFLIGRYAFKIPSFESFYWFKSGLYNNVSEVQNWLGIDKRFKVPKHKLCPIRFYLPFGLLVVMDRVEVLDEERHGYELVRDFIHLNFLLPYDDWMMGLYCVEQKPNNYGILNNKVVIIDYSFYTLEQWKAGRDRYFKMEIKRQKIADKKKQHA